jgi:hypothetical protein
VKFQRWISCDIRATVPVKKSAICKLQLGLQPQIEFDVLGVICFI